MSKDIIDQKVMKMLKLIGLEGYENKNTTLLVRRTAAACGDRTGAGQ